MLRSSWSVKRFCGRAVGPAVLVLFAALGCDPQRAPPAPMGKAAESAGTAGSGGSGTSAIATSSVASNATTTAGGTGGAAEPSCAQPNCPEVLYGPRPGAPQRGIEVDETDIFWCEITFEEGNVVRAAPKSGAGPVRTLGRWHDFPAVPTLIVDDEHVYWMLPEDSGSLLRVDKDGNNPVRTPLPPGSINGRLQLGHLHDAGDAVIIATQGCKEIMRVPKDQSPLELWKDVSPYPNGGGVSGLETDGHFIYCSNDVHLHRLDTETGATKVIVSDLQHGGPLLLLERQLYILSNRGVIGSGENLGVIDLDAAQPSTRDLGPSFGQGRRLLHDANRRTLYWATGLTNLYGTIVSYRLDGTGPPELLFDGQDVYGENAMDDEYFYWLSSNAVRRLKKWP